MNIGICGICGRMGKAILNGAIEKDHYLTTAFDSIEYCDDELKSILENRFSDTTISSINEDDLKKCDGIIDFSSPEATMKLLKIAEITNTPVIIGTTGFSQNELNKIEEYSKKIPLLSSPNWSLGVNLLFKLTEMASKALQNDYDIEIFEAHHKHKKDSPSGTAKKLVEIIKENVSELSDAKEIAGREGIIGERSDNEIGVMAMRGGDIVGEHTVFYAGQGERIELTHRATDRMVFARGAVKAFEFLKDKKKGYYSIFDVLGF